MSHTKMAAIREMYATPRTIDEEMVITKNGKLLARVLQAMGFRASMNQIEATNNWIDNIIPKQIEMQTVNFGEYTLKFGPTFIIPPTISVKGNIEPLSPAKALLAGMDYMAELRTHFTIIKGYDPNDPCAGEIIEQTSQPVKIGSIPAMLKSNICYLAGKSPEELDALGSDRREPGGYYIVKNERLMYYPEKIRTNRFIFGISPKKGFKYVNITADTIRGSVVTTLTAVPHKAKTAMNHIISLTLNNLKQETKTGKKFSQYFNIFKILRIYAVRKQAILPSYEFYMNPYNIQNLVLKFIQPSRRSKCITMMADTIVDAFLGMAKDENVLLDMIKESREKYISKLKKKKKNAKVTEISLEDSMMHSIESSLLSHENHANPSIVIYSTCMMIAMVAEFMAGYVKPTDKDNWGYKRLDCSAKQCEQLLRGFWKEYCTKLTSTDTAADKKANKPMLASLKTKVLADAMAKQFHTSFTVAWGMGTVNVSDNNPTQILQQETFDDKISMLSHTIAMVDSKVKNHKVRSTQPTQWNIIDPAATSENASVGLNKKMAITTHVTIMTDPEPVLDIITGKIGVSGVPPRVYYTFDPKPEDNTDTIILVNSRFKGWCNGPELLRTLIKAKREGVISRKTALIHNRQHKHFVISTDAGRCMNPLLIVENNVPVITTKGLWDADITTLFEEECMEFIDAAELEKIRLAPTEEFLEKWEEDRQHFADRVQEYQVALDSIDDPTDPAKRELYLDTQQTLTKAKAELKNILDNPYTHMMIHPQSMFEPTLANMVLLGYNQSPRITYQSQMGKQSIGVYNSAHDQRFDNDAKLLQRPVKPIVGQQLEKELFLERYQRGKMLSVAFINRLGQTQEDAFMMDKRLVEFGVLDLIHYFVITAELSKDERLVKPPPRHGESPEAYKYLTAQGLPMLNAYLEAGDFVIGKEFVDPKVSDVDRVKNTSIQMKMGEYGFVDMIHVFPTATGIIVKVKIRRNRSHQIGDKESSRYAQKGTTSEILDHTEMPYDLLTGERPSMIINTHSVPKRMTMGYLIEPLISMVAMLSGRRYNASPFEKPDLDEAYKVMKSYGFDATGYRWMRDPRTGLMFRAMVFMGPMFIQILRHLGKEKLQVRAGGVTKLLTNQPPRSGKGGKDGGRKVGEMERTALLSHGASRLLIKILVDMSDAFTTAFCKKCGDIAVVNITRNVVECNVCEAEAKVVKTKIPYVYKVIVQLLMGAMIKIRFDYGGFGKKQMPEMPDDTDLVGDDENAIEDEEVEDEEETPALSDDDEKREVEVESIDNINDEYEQYADDVDFDYGMDDD